MSDQADGNDTRLDNRGGFWPSLRPSEWVTFAVLAGALAGANIYTTLLIGWGDTGSIIAVLGAVLVLGVLGGRLHSVHTINLGQTMASAGGSMGFGMASYAAIYLLDPEFVDAYKPTPLTLFFLFVVMGWMGAMIGSSVRKAMVGYFFPSGTACAVIQETVTQPVEPGQRNRPIFLLKIWGSVAAVLATLKLAAFKNPAEGGHVLLEDLKWKVSSVNGIERVLGLGTDVLFYGIGLVVGPRVGLGMVLGALAGPFIILPSLAGTVPDAGLGAAFGDWNLWMAIAVMTLPTFAAILFAYRFKVPPVIPPGFTPGKTSYPAPDGARVRTGIIVALSAGAMSWAAQTLFEIPWYVVFATMIIAWPLCIVNGRVAGDTDINPVRLVAVVFLAGFFWMVEDGNQIAIMGMAILAGTMAAVAVDMLQDYRTGYLVDANPTHQTSVQLIGTIVGAAVAVPTLTVLMDTMGGIGADTTLKAPGAQAWAGVAKAAANGREWPDGQVAWLIGVSLAFCGYAWLTVWPKTSKWMPSLFGIGIGMLLGVGPCAAIFAGGLLKSVVTWWYTKGTSGDDKATALDAAGNDTMLVGASVFAAAAVMSVILIFGQTALEAMGFQFYWIGGH